MPSLESSVSSRLGSAANVYFLQYVATDAIVAIEFLLLLSLLCSDENYGFVKTLTSTLRGIGRAAIVDDDHVEIYFPASNFLLKSYL
jgi:hypothetical protein